MTRDDDREDVIRERLEAYELQTRPILDYFRRSGCSRVTRSKAARAAPEAIAQTDYAMLLRLKDSRRW